MGRGPCPRSTTTSPPGRTCTGPTGSRNTRTRACSTPSGRSAIWAATSSRCSSAHSRCQTVVVDTPRDLRARIEAHVRANGLIPPGGEVVALVSGGADSTCLWHSLGALGYRVSALHVNHGLRGDESDEDARFCREALGAEGVEAPVPERPTEAALRELRYSFAAGRLRATGHTASDQVETVVYRLVRRGGAGGGKQ